MAEMGKIKVNVGVDLEIRKETAETCLKVVEYYINSHKDIGLFSKDRPEGGVSLWLGER